MEIKLGIGISNIKFGSSITDIEMLLGKPDEIRKDEEYGEFEPMYIYYSEKIRLTFYKNENDRLGYMRCSNPELTINGKKIIGLKIREAKKAFKPIISSGWKLERYDFWHQYFLYKYWIILKCDYDEVTEIELGVPFNNEKEYDWPE